jgi:protein-tyrosine kinase
MTKLLEEIGSRYPDRIILFDSPPLLVTSEARVLANRMGQVIFVVDAEGSKQGDVVRALATIDAAPIKLMLLNRGRADGQAAYGYGYGYGE